MISGTGIVTLRGSGKQYEGELVVCGRWVHLRGRRRVIVNDRPSFRAARPQTWPARKISRVIWLELDQEQTAAA